MNLKELHVECRKKAFDNFEKEIPSGLLLINEMEGYFSRLYDNLEKIGMSGEQNYHRLCLIVSFIRSHFVIDELIQYCENIEAVILIRKQLELLARYKETENMRELKS